MTRIHTGPVSLTTTTYAGWACTTIDADRTLVCWTNNGATAHYAAIAYHPEAGGGSWGTPLSLVPTGGYTDTCCRIDGTRVAVMVGDELFILSYGGTSLSLASQKELEGIDFDNYWGGNAKHLRALSSSKLLLWAADYAYVISLSGSTVSDWQYTDLTRHENFLDEATANLETGIGVWEPFHYNSGVYLTPATTYTSATRTNSPTGGSWEGGEGDYCLAVGYVSGASSSGTSHGVRTPTGTAGIPVEAGVQYQFKCHLKTNFDGSSGWDTRHVGIGISYYDSAGSPVSYAYWSGSADSTSYMWGRSGWLYARLTTPAGAAYASVVVSMNYIGAGSVMQIKGASFRRFDFDIQTMQTSTVIDSSRVLAVYDRAAYWVNAEAGTGAGVISVSGMTASLGTEATFGTGTFPTFPGKDSIFESGTGEYYFSFSERVYPPVGSDYVDWARFFTLSISGSSITIVDRVDSAWPFYYFTPWVFDGRIRFGGDYAYELDDPDQLRYTATFEWEPSTWGLYSHFAPTHPNSNRAVHVVGYSDRIDFAEQTIWFLEINPTGVGESGLSGGSASLAWGGSGRPNSVFLNSGAAYTKEFTQDGALIRYVAHPKQTFWYVRTGSWQVLREFIGVTYLAPDGSTTYDVLGNFDMGYQLWYFNIDTGEYGFVANVAAAGSSSVGGIQGVRPNGEVVLSIGAIAQGGTSASLPVTLISPSGSSRSVSGLAPATATNGNTFYWYTQGVTHEGHLFWARRHPEIVPAPTGGGSRARNYVTEFVLQNLDTGAVTLKFTLGHAFKDNNAVWDTDWNVRGAITPLAQDLNIAPVTNPIVRVVPESVVQTVERPT